jgi:hypothetical protein
MKNALSKLTSCHLAAFFKMLLVLAVVATAPQGCNREKKEDLPLIPIIKGDPPATPTTVVSTPIADAGDEDGDAKSIGSAIYFDNLGACCAALQGNIASAKPPQNIYYQSAAAYCNSVYKSGRSANAVKTIHSILRGAQMPSLCR